jgi:hypothetical protein
MIVSAEVNPSTGSTDAVPEGVSIFWVKGKAVTMPDFKCWLMTIDKDMRFPVDG